MARAVAEMVAEAKTGIENLIPDRAFAELESGEALLVDIREPEERSASGIISGSHHAPRGMLEFYADPSSPYHRDVFDPNRRIILYCASGGRSALATNSMTELGYENVAHVDGGLNLWKESGLPVFREDVVNTAINSNDVD